MATKWNWNLGNQQNGYSSYTQCEFYHSPVASGIPDQTIDEDTDFTTINLDDYVSDPDNTDAQMTWTYTGNIDLTVDITDRVATITRPSTGWNGTETITFTATDPGGLFDSDAATFTVNNLPPIANGQSVTTDEDTAVGITLTGSDPGSDPLAYSIVSGPSHGRLSGTPPNVTYTPGANYNGSDSFMFKASDGTVDSNIATVSTAVNPVNDAPLLAPIGDKMVNEGNLLQCTISATDVDTGDTLSYSASNLPQGATFDPVTKTFSWTPIYDQAGSYSNVHFEVSDGSLTDSEDITITVNNVNRAPTATSLSISPVSPKTGDALAGSYTYDDPDGDSESGTEIRWYKNDVHQSSYDDQLTVPSSATAKGEEWYFTVKPKDGTDFGDLVTSPTVTIQNSPPNALVLSAPADNACVNTATPNFSWSVPTDADGDPLTYRIQIDSPPEVNTGGAITYTPGSALSEGGHTWKVRAHDGTDYGDWSTTRTVGVDTTPPNNVTNLVSTSPSYNNWSNDPNVTVTWTDANDVGCAGLDGYSVLFDHSNSTVPPDTKDAEESVETYTETLENGIWYFHIRAVDNNGNWQSTAHLGPFKIDTTSPDIVKTRCYTDSGKGTEIPHGTWTNDDTLYYEWSDPNSFSDDIFYYELNHSSGNTIGFGEANTMVNHVELTLPSEADNWWFHVAARNGAGTEGPQGVPRKIQIKYDRTEPSNPSVDSADPPINTPTNDSSVDLAWNEGTDNGGSGVAGYSWIVDKIADTTPDQTMEEAGLPSTINLDNDDGDYYVHVRTKDNAGNWTSTYHYGPWELDTISPSVANVTIDTNPIYDGDLDQTIIITYSEAMDQSVKPTVKITGITTPKSDSTGGTWNSATEYEVTITLNDDNEEDSVLDIEVSGAKDSAGNIQVVHTEADAFDVDTENPTAAIGVGTALICDGDLIQEVTVTYDEAMAATPAPTITFDATTGVWSSNGDGAWDGTAKIWAESFTITDADEEVTSVDVVVTGAKDVAGNTQAAKTEANAFNVDTKNPAATVTVAPTTIYEGALVLTVTTTYDEAMDTTTSPVITLTGGHWGAQTDLGWSGSTVFQATFTHDGTQEEIANEVASIAAGSGAKDVAGNAENASTSAGVVVDTKKPTVVGVTPTSLADADAGTVTITITFSEAMDTGVNPTVTVEDLTSSSYTTSNPSWTDATHFTCQFTFVDDNEEATGHYHISEAKDLAGNEMAADNTNAVTVDTKNPTVTVTSTETSPTNANPIPFTITFNEDVNGFVLADITVTNGTAADFTKTVAKRVHTINVTPTADGDVSVTVPADSATDDAGNGNTAGTLTLMADRTAPSTNFTATPPDPDNDPTPTFEWTGTDNHTAAADLVYSTKLDTGAWSAWSADTSMTLARLSEGSHTFQVKAKDEAGNVETTASYTWYIDLTAPEITIDTPPEGAEYTLNEEVIADWSVSDTVGISSSTGSAPDGGFVDTASAGDQVFTVIVTDLAGNTTSLSHTYSVRYVTEPAGAGGSFLESPIGGVAGGGGALGEETLEGAFTIGDIISLRFQLTDANGDYVTDAHPSLSIVEVTIADGEESYTALPEVWAFEYDPETDEYFLNLDTSELTPGIYDLWIAFGDEARERIRIMLEGEM